MARIRTVKPDLFKHEALAEAEFATGLPLRLAFIGLFTQADREGRFLWRPRALKTDILPYDETDFGAVLDALVTWGFVIRYVADGREIGCIPSFLHHQVINHREAASSLSQPPENIDKFDAPATREARDTGMPGHARGEGKGREGKGEIEPDGSILSEPSVADHAKPARARKEYPDDFEAAWLAYPNRAGMSKAEALPQWRKLSDEDRAKVLPSIPAYIAHLKSKPDLETIHFCRYLRYRRFEGFAGAAPQPEDWTKRLTYGRQWKQWPVHQWGPMPGQPDCRVPIELMAEGDGAGWTEARAA